MSHRKTKISDDWKETYAWSYKVDGDPYSAKCTVWYF